MYFLSDLEPGEKNPDIADTVSPEELNEISLQNPVYLNEMGSEEGWNGYVGYAPTAVTDPGTAKGLGVDIVYNITSDVPEPSTFVMLVGFGVASLLSYGWRRWRA